MLPEHVHKTVSKGRAYYTFQRHRGTERAGPRIRLPAEPNTPEFWKAYEAAAARAANGGIEPNSVARLIREYRASAKFKSLKDATRRDYERYLTTFEERLGKFPAGAVTAVVVQDLHDSMADRPVTARHMVSVVKALYAWGVPRGFAKANPARDVDMIEHSAMGAEPWPQWAFDLVAASARWEVRAFVALGLYTGQRTADILQMRLNDLRGDLIPVTQSKTDKPLLIPVHRDLLPTITEARQRGFLYFVPGPRGDALDTNRWRAMWGRELDKDPMKPIAEAKLKPHGLRKSAVCRLAEAGCSDEEISAITGQSAPMVRHYKRLYDQERVARRAMSRWEADKG